MAVGEGREQERKLLAGIQGIKRHVFRLTPRRNDGKVFNISAIQP